MRRVLGLAVLLLGLALQSHAEPSVPGEPKADGAPSSAAGATRWTFETLKADYDHQLAIVTGRRDDTRKRFDAILAGYKTGQRPVAEVVQAYEEWIRNEGAYHSVVASWVIYSEIRPQDLQEYTESPSVTEVAPGHVVPAAEVHEYAQKHGIAPDEAKQRIGQGIAERSVREHAEKYGISVDEARRQLEYYNTHYRSQPK
jgi:hypothetical protein